MSDVGRERLASRPSAGMTVFSLPSCSIHSLPLALYTDIHGVSVSSTC